MTSQNNSTHTIPYGYKQTEVGIIPNDWEVIKLKDIFRVTRGQVLSMTLLESNKVGNYKYPVYSSQTLNNGLAGFYKNYLFEDCITWTTDGAKAGEVKYRPGKFYCTNVCGVLVNKDGYSNTCIASIFNSISRKYVSYVGNPKLMNNVVAEIQIAIPPKIEEQDNISRIINDLDSLIQKTEKLIEKKSATKQAVASLLLSGKQRLPGFSQKWSNNKLGELLDYIQPTKYLVKSTDYSDDFTVPVLTAGKTFILGYTNESFGLFNNLPTIIFDDFTTASKYVDFNFKAKSSAMKMLVPRNKEVCLRFVFEKMQKINFILGDHKRYWISEYQNNEIEIPEHDEQVAIAEKLTDMDNEINKIEKKLVKYNQIKQGVMQVLLTGKIRLNPNSYAKPITQSRTN